MSRDRRRLLLISLVAIAASLALPTVSSAYDFELLTVLDWTPIGDANPFLSYRFESFHRLEFTQFTGPEAIYPVVFNTSIYKNNRLFGIKDICNRFGIISAVTFTCSNFVFQECPGVEGQWYAYSEAEILLSVIPRIVGPVFANCPSGGGCFAGETATTILPLDAAAREVGQDPSAASPLPYPLTRVRRNDKGRFVMDEWAVILPESDSRQTRGLGSSSAAFRDAVDAHLGAPPSGASLVIQEPVHPLNSRWIPLPEIEISDTSLAAARRGGGEIVAVRAEAFGGRRLEDLQVLYASGPVDEAWLRRHLERRVSLRFASDQQHPTVVFLVLRIGEQLEALSALPVLVQCCCDPFLCQPEV